MAALLEVKGEERSTYSRRSGVEGCLHFHFRRVVDK
jgi:hypothetical protein